MFQKEKCKKEETKKERRKGEREGRRKGSKGTGSRERGEKGKKTVLTLFFKRVLNLLLITHDNGRYRSFIPIYNFIWYYNSI